MEHLEAALAEIRAKLIELRQQAGETEKEIKKFEGLEINLKNAIQIFAKK
jgi:hypothetical protein